MMNNNVTGPHHRGLFEKEAKEYANFVGLPSGMSPCGWICWNSVVAFTSELEAIFEDEN